jgi:hypothetical protein
LFRVQKIQSISAFYNINLKNVLFRLFLIWLPLHKF